MTPAGDRVAEDCMQQKRGTYRADQLRDHVRRDKLPRKGSAQRKSDGNCRIDVCSRETAQAPDHRHDRYAGRRVAGGVADATGIGVIENVCAGGNERQYESSNALSEQPPGQRYLGGHIIGRSLPAHPYIVPARLGDVAPRGPTSAGETRHPDR